MGGNGSHSSGSGRDRDFPPVFSWDWVGKRLIFVGVGRERFENSLPCHPLVCTWMGQIKRTYFTAGTLYNCVCDLKKKIYIYIFFFQNRYPIMVKCLNIGKNIGKPIYQSISN